MPVKYVTVGSVATYVHHRGQTTLPGRPPTATSGTAVLCVHDVTGNGNAFAGVLDALAADTRPFAFDLPAHGRSGGLDSLATISEMAAHLKELADFLDLGSPVLVGDGMGAAIALEAAAQWPAWPLALVLCGGASGTPAPASAEIDQVRLVTAGRSRRQFDTAAYGPNTAKAVFERAFGDWMKTDPRATLGDLQALASWDASSRVGAVSASVTVVVGEHEPEAARAAAESLAAALVTGSVVTLAGAARRCVYEQPERLAAIIASVASASGRTS